MARDAPSIDAYGGGGFRVAGDWRPGSLLILSDRARPWPVAGPAEITVEALAEVIAAGPQAVEFLLLGMGPKNALPSRAVREALLAAGLGLEYMDTPAAARMYNVLTSEGRRVAAALVAV